jgi:sugar fermentation stimulation protein A
MNEGSMKDTAAGLETRGDKICFSEPLAQATIIRRPNRFIIDVEVEGTAVACHCPTTGRIGNLVLDGLPCLLSRSHSSTRKTPYTVEAVSVDPPGAPEPVWIGINQTAANRYVEQALSNGLLQQIVTAEPSNARRSSAGHGSTSSSTTPPTSR